MQNIDIWVMVYKNGEVARNSILVEVPSRGKTYKIRKDVAKQMNVTTEQVSIWKPHMSLAPSAQEELRDCLRKNGNKFDAFCEPLLNQESEKLVTVFPGASTSHSTFWDNANPTVPTLIAEVYTELYDHELADLQLFWQQFWVDREDPFEQQVVHRDSDCIIDVEVPETCKILRHLPTVFRHGDVLIRDQYEEALEAIKGYEAAKMKAAVIVGHPGIGKSIFLYYLLVHRLLVHEATLFQYSNEFILLFDENGVTRHRFNSNPPRAPPPSTWALVDTNQTFSNFAPMLITDGSPYFTVIASSPRMARWEVVAHHRPPFKLWFMEPFTLGELIQARHLQQEPTCNERELQQFFELFGSSARDCYAYCSNISYYHMLIEDRIKSMTWLTITDALKGTPLQLDEGSHKVILIAPDPEDHEKYRPHIITKAVASMVCQRDSNKRWQNAHNLYRSLRLDPETKSSAGWLLEPPFHNLCVTGTDFQIYPMQRISGGNINEIFANVGYTNQQTLALAPQKLVSFDKIHPINILSPNHYYQPICGTQPSFDSFIYDPTAPCITLFQVTNGKSHSVNALGISFILELAKRLQLPVPKPRFVAVIPEGDEIRLMVPKGVAVMVELFFLEVSEGQLFPY